METYAIDKALDDVQCGRVYKAESVDAMFKQILGSQHVGTHSDIFWQQEGSELSPKIGQLKK